MSSKCIFRSVLLVLSFSIMPAQVIAVGGRSFAAQVKPVFASLTKKAMPSLAAGIVATKPFGYSFASLRRYPLSSFKPVGAVGAKKFATVFNVYPMAASLSDEICWLDYFQKFAVGSAGWKAELSWKFYTLLERFVKRSLAWGYHHLNTSYTVSLDRKVTVAFVYLDDSEARFSLAEDENAWRIFFCEEKDLDVHMKRLNGTGSRHFFMHRATEGHYCVTQFVGYHLTECDTQVFSDPLLAVRYIAQEINRDVCLAMGPEEFRAYQLRPVITSE